MKKSILLLVALAFVTIGYSQEIIHLDDNSFKENVWNYQKNKDWKYEGNKVAIVDFYADWCGPCKMIAPHLKDLQKEYGKDIQVYKVNTDEHGNLAGLFGIRGIPTLILVSSDGTYKKLVGYRSKEQLKKIIDEAM